MDVEKKFKAERSFKSFPMQAKLALAGGPISGSGAELLWGRPAEAEAWAVKFPVDPESRLGTPLFT